MLLISIWNSFNVEVEASFDSKLVLIVENGSSTIVYFFWLKELSPL
jgi:hypothetical protein